MKLQVLICFAAFLPFTKPVFAVTNIPDITVEECHVLFGHFKVPQTSVVEEIYRRMANDDECGHDVQERFVGSKESWQMSLVFKHTIVTPRIGEAGSHQSLTMKIIKNPLSLVMAYFTTKFVPFGVSENSTLVYMLDSIDVTDGRITVKRGKDYLVAQFHLGDDCKTNMGKPTLTENSTTYHNSWYPDHFDFSACEDNANNYTTCDSLEKHRCRMEKIESDFCFSNQFEGKKCDASVKVVSMTGIFREKSLLEDYIPTKSIVGEYFAGQHHRGVVYPCLYGDK